MVRIQVESARGREHRIVQGAKGTQEGLLGEIFDAIAPFDADHSGHEREDRPLVRTTSARHAAGRPSARGPA